MKKNLPYLLSLFLITGLMWNWALTPVMSTPPLGWSGDDNLAFLLNVNGVPAADSDLSNPISLESNATLTLELTINVNNNLTLHSGKFMMSYMGFPIVNQPFELNQIIPAGFSAVLMNTTLSLGDLLSAGGIDLFTGTVIGSFSFTYSLNLTAPYTNTTVSDDFVLKIGGTGAAALLSVSGLLTVGFTVMAVFSLLMALDDFQQGILAARKMRGASRASEVGIFPKPVVLRRKSKKKGETIDMEELKRRVSQLAANSWDGKRCPKCHKKWKKDAPTCSKCKITKDEALKYFSADIAEYAPKAVKIVKPKSKITVGKFSKRLKLKPNKGGALAAALTDMGVFRTRSVKVPVKKVAMAGMTLASTYWSWQQIFGNATPSWVDLLLSFTLGLSISVLIAYFMKWLARVPRFGYEK